MGLGSCAFWGCGAARPGLFFSAYDWIFSQPGGALAGIALVSHRSTARAMIVAVAITDNWILG